MIWSTPGYSGQFRSYFSAIDFVRNLPPTKCLPWYHFTHGFGAVRLINAWGINLEPGPSEAGPFSMFQELGTSTLRTGTEVASICEIIEGKGSRSEPLNEKPKIASTTRSTDFKASVKSGTNGTERFLS